MLKDSMGVVWLVPQIVWPHVREINRTLRLGAEDLELPRDASGTILCDLHNPDVQKWLLNWPGAPIALGAVLLQDQATELKLDEMAFAGRWSGDAIDALRSAIWEAWVNYLPPSARTLAQQIKRAAEEMRAAAAEHIQETFDLLIQSGSMQMTTQLQKCRLELAKMSGEKKVVRGRKTTSSGSPAASASTPSDSA